MIIFERVIALSLVLAGASAIYIASELSLWSGYTVGPGVAPIGFGIGVVVCAAIIALRPSSSSDEFSLGPLFRRVIVLGIILAALPLLAEYLGFGFSIFFFALATLTAVIRMNAAHSLVFSAAWTGLLYFAFAHLLRVPFPAGLFF